MPVTIRHTRLPADATQQAELRKLFTSPGFLYLKELVAARCSEFQISAAKALVYPQNEAAQSAKDIAVGQAVLLNAVLDLLDDIEQNDQEWFTVRLENSR